MKTLRTRSFTLLILLLVTLNTVPVSAQLKSKKSSSPPKAPSKSAEQKAPTKAAPEPADDKESAVIVESLLSKSGQKYTSAGGGVWTINRQGKSRYFQVVLYTAPGTLSTEIIVPRGNSARSLNEMALDLLRLASRLNYVKIGVDKDDLVVRNEARLKSLNVEEFNDNIEKVVAAADMVLGVTGSK